MPTDSKEDLQDGGTLSEYDDRDLVLLKLNDSIDYLHNKAIKGRIKNAKNETVRTSWFKTLAYTCSIYNQIKRDTELDELKKEIETLKSIINDMKKRRDD